MIERLVSDYLVSIEQLDGAIQLPAMLNGEIEKAAQKATDFQPKLLEALVREGKDQGFDAVRIRIVIEPMTSTQAREEYNRT